MELWDAEDLDLEGPAYIEFGRTRQGEFQFGVLQSGIDYRLTQRDGQRAVEFSWEGDSEGDQMCGRGCALQDRDGLQGWLYNTQRGRVLISGGACEEGHSAACIEPLSGRGDR